MATVTSRTEAGLAAIEAGGIKAAGLNAAGHLTLTKNDDSVIDAGSVAAPTGTVVMFAGAAIPAGWLLCTGQAVSRATYSALYAVLGDVFGAGDGSTTFNVPNMETRMPRQNSPTLGTTGGSSAHVHTMGAHTHGGPSHDHQIDGGSIPAHARVALTTGPGPNIHEDRFTTGVPAWDANFQADMTNNVASTTNKSTATRVQGVTATGGTGNTASGGGATNTAAPSGNTGWPPYLNLNFIIKT
jgi:microcystin-dependent protein